MAFFGLHHHARHRARQMRWVLPIVGLLAAATLVTLIVQFQVSSQDVGTEFFHAHKTISNTSQLLVRGTVIGGAILALLVVAVAIWALRMTHRIVRPVHTLHRALDALVAGELGVRVALHRADEFREVGDALNRLVDEFSATLAKIHELVDRIAALTGSTGGAPQEPAPDAQVRALIAELDQTMDFFRLGPHRTIREDGR